MVLCMALNWHRIYCLGLESILNRFMVYWISFIDLIDLIFRNIPFSELEPLILVFCYYIFPLLFNPVSNPVFNLQLLANPLQNLH